MALTGLQVILTVQTRLRKELQGELHPGCFTSVKYTRGKGIAGSEGTCILALGNCFQSGGTKEIAFCYWCISWSESEPLFRCPLPFLFSCSELLFHFFCPFVTVVVGWSVSHGLTRARQILQRKSCSVFYVGAIFPYLSFVFGHYGLGRHWCFCIHMYTFIYSFIVSGFSYESVLYPGLFTTFLRFYCIFCGSFFACASLIHMKLIGFLKFSNIRSSLILSLSRWRNSCTSTIYVKIHHFPIESPLRYIKSSHVLQLFSDFLILLCLSISLFRRQHCIYTITNCSDIWECKSYSRKSSLLFSLFKLFLNIYFAMWYLRLYYPLPKRKSIEVLIKAWFDFYIKLRKMYL